MKTGLGDPQGDSVWVTRKGIRYIPDVGSLSPQSELKPYLFRFF